MKKILLLAAVALAAAIPVRAQVTAGNYLYVYPLTNGPSAWQTNGSIGTNILCITNGFLAMNSNLTYTVACQPFQIWRGRGFALNAQFLGTNAGSGTLTFGFRFATIHAAPWNSTTTFVTNWNTGPLYYIAFAANGTTAVNLATNVPPTNVDNFQLGQLYTIATGSTTPTGYQLDPTNTFISVFPPYP